jgi:hypothetical protein
VFNVPKQVIEAVSKETGEDESNSDFIRLVKAYE